MRPYTPKRQAQNAAAEPMRKALKRSVGRCEVCLKRRNPEYLCIHEISNGNGPRLNALDKPFALLVVCREPDFMGQKVCHDMVQKESEVRQLARLYLVDQSRFDLPAYLTLTRPTAPNRITLTEVMQAADEILNVGVYLRMEG